MDKLWEAMNVSKNLMALGIAHRCMCWLHTELLRIADHRGEERESVRAGFKGATRTDEHWDYWSQKSGEEQ